MKPYERMGEMKQGERTPRSTKQRKCNHEWGWFQITFDGDKCITNGECRDCKYLVVNYVRVRTK